MIRKIAIMGSEFSMQVGKATRSSTCRKSKHIFLSRAALPCALPRLTLTMKSVLAMLVLAVAASASVSVWPQPATMTTGPTVLEVDPSLKFVLDGGRVAEVGPPDELAAKPEGVFAALLRRQRGEGE